MMAAFAQFGNLRFPSLSRATIFALQCAMSHPARRPSGAKITRCTQIGLSRRALLIDRSQAGGKKAVLRNSNGDRSGNVPRAGTDDQIGPGGIPFFTPRRL